MAGAVLADHPSPFEENFDWGNISFEFVYQVSVDCSVSNVLFSTRGFN